MNKYDLAIIGSGMGGSMTAALNNDKNTILFERDRNLGGCASTFKRFGSYFNAGATTFVGYEDNHPVKNIFDKAKFTPSLLKSDIAIRVLQDGKVIDRVKDFENFLEQINKTFPNKNNRAFWEKIRELDKKFWSINEIYFGKYSFDSYLKTAKSVWGIFSVFKFDLLKSAKSFIQETLGDISKEYQDFIDAQLLITLQTTSKDISVVSLALGLSYPFHDVFYVNGGMGSLFDGLLKDIELKRKEEITKVIRENNLYRIISSKDEYLTKDLVLNSSIYNSLYLFEDKQIQKYYDSFSFSDQSAFIINFTINKKIDSLHHYQIILDEKIPNSISYSFFVSISSNDDEIMSKKGLSVTISTHTKAKYWKDLSKEEYEKQKMITQEFIIEKFLENFEKIIKKDIINIFSATSKTFKRYINRYNCGGRAITIKNILNTPSSKTPFKGLYNVGDTIFAGQGWPGVAIGVKILNKELNG